MLDISMILQSSNVVEASVNSSTHFIWYDCVDISHNSRIFVVNFYFSASHQNLILLERMQVKVSQRKRRTANQNQNQTGEEKKKSKQRKFWIIS